MNAALSFINRHGDVVKKFSVFAAALCVFLVGCDKDKTPQENFEVNKPVLLVEIDGVRLYKMRDDTRGGATYVYFTTRGDTTWIRGCGKGCTQTERVDGAWD